MRRRMQKYNQEVEEDCKIKAVKSKWGVRVLLLLKWSLIPLANWTMQTNLANQIGNIKHKVWAKICEVEHKQLSAKQLQMWRWANND
jgi:hypothetical protein